MQGIIARARRRKRLAPASLPVVSAMLITLVVPLAILYAGKVFSVRYSTYKKFFAAGLVAVGLLEKKWASFSSPSQLTGLSI